MKNSADLGGCYIHLGLRPLWITPSLTGRILHIRLSGFTKLTHDNHVFLPRPQFQDCPRLTCNRNFVLGMGNAAKGTNYRHGCSLDSLLSWTSGLPRGSKTYTTRYKSAFYDLRTNLNSVCQEQKFQKKTAPFFGTVQH